MPLDAVMPRLCSADAEMAAWASHASASFRIGEMARLCDGFLFRDDAQRETMDASSRNGMAISVWPFGVAPMGSQEAF